MSGWRKRGTLRCATGLLALVSLFHVQWLAACEMAPAGDARGCCIEGQAGHEQHCQEDVADHDCVAPFAKSGSTGKSVERSADRDHTPDHSPLALQAPVVFLVAGDDRPSRGSSPTATADGRHLYLTSSRLRL